MAKPINELTAAVLSTARSYLGYTSEVHGRNIFNQQTGYPLAPWAGSFIDVVLRESGLHKVPSFTYTPAALAELIRSGQVSTKPKPGDIAIFNFASNTASAFSLPHAGIVTDVRHFKSTRTFTTIEGNTVGENSHQNKDGVHQRIRHLSDTVIFCRVVDVNGTRQLSTSNEAL